jgi:GNAT superfamily N-acetyltransferase
MTRRGKNMNTGCGKTEKPPAGSIKTGWFSESGRGSWKLPPARAITGTNDAEGNPAREIKIINENKKAFMDLLLLADEQEDMIEKYLDRGTLFALYDGGLKSICVVTDEGGGSFELQSLATVPQFQGKGYATRLVRHIFEYYKGKGRAMVVGTGDVPSIVSFYERCGFVFSHRLENYFTEHYREPMFEDGVQLKDKVYFRKDV